MIDQKASAHQTEDQQYHTHRSLDQHITLHQFLQRAQLNPSRLSN
jgi:hypothetical protein